MELRELGMPPTGGPDSGREGGDDSVLGRSGSETPLLPRELSRLCRRTDGGGFPRSIVWMWQYGCLKLTLDTTVSRSDCQWVCR